MPKQQQDPQTRKESQVPLYATLGLDLLYQKSGPGDEENCENKKKSNANIRFIPYFILA